MGGQVQVRERNSFSLSLSLEEQEGKRSRGSIDRLAFASWKPTYFFALPLPPPACLYLAAISLAFSRCESLARSTRVGMGAASGLDRAAAARSCSDAAPSTAFPAARLPAQAQQMQGAKSAKQHILALCCFVALKCFFKVATKVGDRVEGIVQW